jgi:hypothetical protein
MRGRRSTAGSSTAAFACNSEDGIAVIRLAVAVLLLHHSFAADFDITKPVTLTGTVTKIEWTNPHVHIQIAVKGDRWTVEMGSPNGLGRQGWTSKTMKAGDVITVAGSRAKDGSRTANAKSIVLPTGVRMSAASQGATS